MRDLNKRLERLERLRMASRQHGGVLTPDQIATAPPGRYLLVPGMAASVAEWERRACAQQAELKRLSARLTAELIDRCRHAPRPE